MAVAEKEKAERVEAASEANKVLKAGDEGYAYVFTVVDRHDPSIAKDYLIMETVPLDFMELTNIVLDKAEALHAEGLLSWDAWKGLQTNDYASIMPSLSKLWKMVPEVFYKVIGIMLDTNPNGVEFAMKNIGIRRLSEILKEWAIRNPWRDIAEDFFRLGEEWGLGMAEIRKYDPAKPSTFSQSSRSLPEPATAFTLTEPSAGDASGTPG